MDLEQTFLKDPFTHTCNNTCMFMFIVYALRAHVSAQIFTKFLLQAHYYLIDKMFKALVAK